jgi:hypothetical protein
MMWYDVAAVAPHPCSFPPIDADIYNTNCVHNRPVDVTTVLTSIPLLPLPHSSGNHLVEEEDFALEEFQCYLDWFAAFDDDVSYCYYYEGGSSTCSNICGM